MVVDKVQASLAEWVLRWTAKLLEANGAHRMTLEWRPLQPGVFDLDQPPPPGVMVTVSLLVEWRWDFYAKASDPVEDPCDGVIQVCKCVLNDRPNLDRSKVPFMGEEW